MVLLQAGLTKNQLRDSRNAAVSRVARRSEAVSLNFEISSAHHPGRVPRPPAGRICAVDITIDSCWDPALYLYCRQGRQVNRQQIRFTIPSPTCIMPPSWLLRPGFRAQPTDDVIEGRDSAIYTA